MFCYYQTLKLIQKVLFDSKAFICWWGELIFESLSFVHKNAGTEKMGTGQDF